MSLLQPPAGGTTAGTSAGTASEPATAANNDSVIQADIDKQLTDDPTLSSLGITATVMNAKVTLIGSVKTEAMKSQVERMVRKIKGVKDVDNQITVVAD